MSSTSRGLRRQALQKIAALAANATTATTKSAPAASSDLDRLLKACSLHERNYQTKGNNLICASESRSQKHTPMVKS